MVLDSILSSPHRRSPSFRKPFPRDDLGSWSTLYHRHRFLLTALALLAFLCTIYLYFAVTLGATSTCSELTGSQKALCRLEHAKASIAKGKLKIL
ncbi:Ephrin-A3 [Quillaja saponaria]|uniref:Ephrin-A3 n=1 Tax=Quillaja saponaria TaxID=32244 RepID=A0AAD7L623_QUISA|nr:Ephrin-A3 [Quillaja saponaria]